MLAVVQIIRSLQISQIQKQLIEIANSLLFSIIMRSTLYQRQWLTYTVILFILYCLSLQAIRQKATVMVMRVGVRDGNI